MKFYNILSSRNEFLTFRNVSVYKQTYLLEKIFHHSIKKSFYINADLNKWVTRTKAFNWSKAILIYPPIATLGV